MISNDIIKAQVMLERLKNGEIKDFQKVLKQLDRAVRSILAGYTKLPTDLARIRRELRAAQSELWGQYLDSLWDNLESLSTHEANVEAGILTSQAISVGVNIGKIKTPGLWSKTLTRPITGTGDLLEPYVKGLAETEIRRIEREVMISWGMGRTVQETLKAIRGTAANVFRDGALNATLNDAKTIIQTAYQHVSSVAYLESSLSAGLDEYQLVATLDSRTSKLCRSLDLTIHKTGEGPVPPFHPRCRTRMVPYWGKEEKPGTRSSALGYVPQDESFYEWLSKMPDTYQNESLGPTWAKLFREGGVTPEDFSKRVINNLQPLTLSEMRSRYPEMFQKANL